MSRNSSRMPGASINSNTARNAPPRSGWQMKVSIAPSLGRDIKGLFDHLSLLRTSGRSNEQPTTIAVPAKAGTHFSARELLLSGHHRRKHAPDDRSFASPWVPAFAGTTEIGAEGGDGGAGDRTAGQARGGFPAADRPRAVCRRRAGDRPPWRTASAWLRAALTACPRPYRLDRCRGSQGRAGSARGIDRRRSEAARPRHAAAAGAAPQEEWRRGLRLPAAPSRAGLRPLCRRPRRLLRRRDAE